MHLAVKSEWSQKPVYDVIATLRGSTYPDQWVIRGNHHDGWVFGAADPLAGQVALMSEAKALGALHRNGWQPKRTIVYASWDAEEPGLIGSTEWVEEHAAELKDKAILYLNTDNPGRGFWYAGGSHELQHFANAAARGVIDPQTGVSVVERARARILAEHYETPASVEPWQYSAAKSGGDLPLYPLGSGSDYSAFFQHLGIATVDTGFGGEESEGGSYHSVYDSFNHVMKFDDPGMKYGAAVAKVVGHMVLAAAGSERVPAVYSSFAGTVQRYVEELGKLARDQRMHDRERKDLTDEGVFKLASLHDDPTTAPVDKGITPLIDLLPLQDAADRLERSAHAADAMLGGYETLPAETRAKVDAQLRSIDQALIDPTGLPGRPWFKNLVYAPGTLTGYGAKTLPGVREAIEQRRWDDARAYVGKTAAVLNGYADRLDKAVAEAKGG